MSAATPTHIANRALDILGRGPTGNIENPKSPLEQRLKERYADAVRMMLRLDRWPAALKVEKLAGSTLEEDRYFYQVQLPADCVHVWRVWGPSEIPARLELRSYGLYYEDDDYHGRYSWERRNAQGAGAIACNFTPPVTVASASACSWRSSNTRAISRRRK